MTDNFPKIYSTKLQEKRSLVIEVSSMFTSVHNLDPLPLDQNPNSQFVSFKYLANLVAFGFQHLLYH